MRRSRALRSGAAALCLLTLGACGLMGGEEEDSGAPEYSTIVIAMPDWTGGQATAAMAAHVLENEFGVSVELRDSDQETAWEQLGTGEVHAILEDWGALPEDRALYVEEKQNVIDAGRLGITGQVGWYVTRRFAEAHPEARRAERLNAFTDELDGRLLHADPHYATRDRQIIDDLGLDYRPVAAGSETALIETLTGAERSGHPVLTYLWRPHWLHTEVGLTEVELPQGEAYPEIELRKYLNAYFSETGGDAAEFLRNFTWSEADENAVARLIAEDGFTPRHAAEQWARNHPERVAAWLPPADQPADEPAD
jgi:glycine betaine/proline transport system substrate-binding protein